jgi:hypothetical protein
MDWFGLTRGREVGSPHRRFTDKYFEYLNFINHCNTQKKPCYISVQPYHKRDQVYGLEKVFFDFDSKEDPRKAFDEARDFVETLVTYYRVKPLLLFSGMKGCHVYIFLWNTIILGTLGPIAAKAIYRRLQEKLLLGLTYETLDRAVLGNIKQLGRLPYSIHSATGQQCIPIDVNGDALLLESVTKYRQHALDRQFFIDVCHDVATMQRIQRPNTDTHNSFTRAIRPLVQHLIEEGRRGRELSHQEHLAILFELLAAKKSDDEIQRVFRQLLGPDYQEKQTRYFIHHARARKYKPFKTKTLEMMIR